MTLADALAPYTVATSEFPQLGAAVSGETGRPYWQTEPCPGWCTGGHENRDDREDRTHFGVEHRVPMLLETPITYGNAVDGPHESEYATTYLRQQVEHRDPTIWLGKGENGNGLILRLEEAEALAEALTALVREALR